MNRNSLSDLQAIKYIDAHLAKDMQPTLAEISEAVVRVNRLIDDEEENGLGTQKEQIEIFEGLVFHARKKQYVGMDRFTKWMLAKLVLTKWAEKSNNPYAMAYQVGHDDGSINGAFHANKRATSKAQKTIKITVNRAANGRRLIGATSRAKVQKAAQAFKHLSKSNASYEMAELLNLDAGTIKRYLTELFPGDKWKQ
jgi:hypothetical protein